MQWFCSSLTMAMLVAVCVSPANAQLTSPQIGWEAKLSTLSHNVSGTVSVLDPNTLLFNDFTFDGGGLSIFFYLGAEDSQSAFTSGLPIGVELLGSVFDGTQEPFTVDLPSGITMEGWNAISVWCVSVGANFGSGSFSADFDGNGDVDGRDFLKWQRGELSHPLSQSDLTAWEVNYGKVAALSAASMAVPEPATIVLLGGLAAVVLAQRRRNHPLRHLLEARVRRGQCGNLATPRERGR